MPKRLLIIAVCKLLLISFLSGQCPDRSVLWKRIVYLRDSSGIPLNNQLTELLPYVEKIKKCPDNGDSVHALLLQRIGGMYLLMKDYVTGINYINRSVAIIHENAGKPYINRGFLTRCYYGLQICYDSLKQGANRRACMDSCISIAIQLKTGYNYAIPLLVDKAAYLFEIGDYFRSINYAEIGQSIIGENAAIIYDASIYSYNFAVWKLNCLVFLKKMKEAEVLVDKIVSTITPSKADSLGAIYGLYARALADKGDFSNALLNYRKCIFYNSKINKAESCAEALNNIGYLIFFKGKHEYKTALQYYYKALAYRDSTESLNIFGNIATVYVKSGRYDSALYFFQKAFDQFKPGITESGLLLNLYNKTSVKTIEYITGLVLDKADAYLSWHKTSTQPGALNEAIRIYKIADRLFDIIKVPQAEIQSKLSWRSNNRRLYENAIEACRLSNNMNDAFYFFEKSRAVLLNDQLKEQRWLGNEDILKLSQVKKELKNAASEKDIVIHEQELERLQQLIKQRNPLYYQSFLDTSLISLQDVREKLLHDHQALFEIFNGDSAVYTLLVTSGKTYFNTINKKSFDSTVDQYLRYIGDPALLNRQFDNYRKTAFGLYQLLFQQNTIPAGRIIISPDGRYFPFEALLTNVTTSSPSWFLNDHAVSYTYSANYLVNDFGQSTTGHKKSFMGVAPVNFPAAPGLSTLGGSDLSLQRIGSYFADPLSLTGTGATKNNFMQQFSSCQVIQLYAHASDSSSKGEPVIWFADSALYLSDLIPEEKPATRLIVLSACETGSGKNYRGEGIFSFNRGFAAFGIPSSVTNLWDIDNKSTYRLTELFYKYLSQKEPPDIALQKAKLEFIKTGPGETTLPYYWAATILAGQTNKIEYTEPFNWTSLIIIIVAACAGLLILFLTFRRFTARK